MAPAATACCELSVQLHTERKKRINYAVLRFRLSSFNVCVRFFICSVQSWSAVPSFGILLRLMREKSAFRKFLISFLEMVFVIVFRSLAQRASSSPIPVSLFLSLPLSFSISLFLCIIAVAGRCFFFASFHFFAWVRHHAALDFVRNEEISGTKWHVIPFISSAGRNEGNFRQN